MKRSLKIFLVILLVLLLGLEAFFYFTKYVKNENNGIINNGTKKGEKIDTEHLANIFTGYNSDNLTYDGIKESDQVYYTTISGLKNKTVEDKVNKKIKEKIDELKLKKDPESVLYNKMVSNFENTLSMVFYEENTAKTDKYGSSYYKELGSLNFDLTTGNQIKLNDIVNDMTVLKNKLLKVAHEDFSLRVGIACEGGPCEIQNPDYSMIEDQQFSIASKFNKGEYYFVYTPEELAITFYDTKIKNTKSCWDKTDGCHKAIVGGTEMYVYDDYETTYTARIKLLDLLDNIIIYDKFKTSDNIYEKDSTKVERKFTLKPTEDQGYESVFIETDKYFVDYSLIGTFDKKYLSTVKDSLLKEMVTNNDKYTLYDVFGDTGYIYNSTKSYDYVYYNVYQYELDKNIFENNKKQIYIDKYSKVDLTEGPYYIFDETTKDYRTYSYLKDYQTKKKFFYYIYDVNGNRVDTSNILNKDYLATVIPSEWYSLGKYNNIDDMVKNALIIKGDRSYPNNLVINIADSNEISLKYKGKVLYIAGNYDEYKNVINQLYK